MAQPSSPPGPLRSGRGLAGFSAVVVAFMVLVILEGAVVRATGSGAGCGQHWPLCNGEILPHHPRLATMIEFTHRSLTGICTTLVAILIAWTFLARPRRDRARRAAVLTGIFLLTEGALGAVLVLGGYVEHNTSNARVLVQSIHFTNTMLLLGFMTLTWWWNRPRPAVSLAGAAAPRSAAIASVAATLVTGATGSVAALADTLFPSPTLRAALAYDFDPHAPLLIHMRWMHPASTAISLLAIGWLALRLRGAASRWLLGLAALQIVLGLADIALLAPISLQVLHLLGADLLWIGLVVASAEALRPASETDLRQSPRSTEPLISAF